MSLFRRHRPEEYQVSRAQMTTLEEQFHQVETLKAQINKLADDLILAAYERKEQQEMGRNAGD